MRSRAVGLRWPVGRAYWLCPAVRWPVACVASARCNRGWCYPSVISAGGTALNALEAEMKVDAVKELIAAADAVADALADLRDPGTGIDWKLDPRWASEHWKRLRLALLPFREDRPCPALEDPGIRIKGS